MCKTVCLALHCARALLTIVAIFAMKFLPLLLLFVISLLSACSSPVPDANDLTKFEKQAEQLAQHDIEMLDAQRASGEITEYEYNARKQALLANIHDRAIDALWTHHAIDQAERKAMGLPTPDKPQDINVPTADSLPTGSERRAFNSGNQTYGATGNPQAVKEFFKGYTPGNAVRGNTGRGGY
jgi:uncharacterized membrane protein